MEGAKLGLTVIGRGVGITVGVAEGVLEGVAVGNCNGKSIKCQRDEMTAS